MTSKPADVRPVPRELGHPEPLPDALEEMDVVGTPADAAGLGARFAADPDIAGTVVRGDRVSFVLRSNGAAADAARQRLSQITRQAAGSPAASPMTDRRVR